VAWVARLEVKPTSAATQAETKRMRRGSLILFMGPFYPATGGRTLRRP
jgi:hypothetical protein